MIYRKFSKSAKYSLSSNLKRTFILFRICIEDVIIINLLIFNKVTERGISN